MTIRSLLAAIALVAATALMAGCGSAQETGNSATLAPATARVLAELDGDLDSAQWHAARELVDRFPDGDKLLHKLDEVYAVAGHRIVLVALNDEEAVALTQPHDAAKLRSLVAEYHFASREIEGWTAIAEDAATLDAYEHSLESGTLDGDERYEAARSALPDEALATVYARGESEGDWTAFALTAEDDGFRVAGHLRTASATARPALDPALVAEVPGDALAVLAFGGGKLPMQLPNLLGIDLAPLADVLSGGAVVWVRPGVLIPEVSAILPKPNAAEVDLLLRGLTGATPEDTQLDGQPARRVRLGPVTVTYADLHGRLVLTTGDSLRAGGGLTGARGFEEARDKVGLTDSSGGFVYVDVQQVASLLGFAGWLDLVPRELTRNLEHVRWLYAGYGGRGTDRELAGFVAIR